MNRRVLFALALLCALGVARTSSAHHPLAELFDRDSTVVVTGTITSVEWVNPHATLRLAVERDGSAPETWVVEMAPPHALSLRGWTPQMLPVGETVTITGFASLDGSHRTAVREIELTSGERLTVNMSWNWLDVVPEFEVQPLTAR